MVKPEDMNMILKKFIQRNPEITVDKFLNGNAHFLNIKINGKKTDLYLTETQTDRFKTLGYNLYNKK